MKPIVQIALVFALSAAGCAPTPDSDGGGTNNGALNPGGVAPNATFTLQGQMRKTFDWQCLSTSGCNYKASLVISNINGIRSWVLSLKANAGAGSRNQIVIDYAPKIVANSPLATGDTVGAFLRDLSADPTFPAIPATYTLIWPTPVPN
jgi:hypothetical protein